MTELSRLELLRRFEEALQRILDLEPRPPAPKAKWCGESPHRTLGHLTSCQAAWLPLMQMLREGVERGSIPINPDPLFTKLRFATSPWPGLTARFTRDRDEWRSLLSQIDPNREIVTPKRAYTAFTLTKRMVDHEIRHLDNLRA